MTKSALRDSKNVTTQDKTASDKFWCVVSIIAAGLAFFLALWVF